MKLETRMSLGYVKGKYWVSDDRYKAYTETEAYKALTRACRLAGMTFECSYSYVARQYTAEVITIEKFANSGNFYFVKHSNAYHGHPMVAVATAIRKYERVTPLLQVVCLELECMVLKEALAAARYREAIEAKLNAALDDLGTVLDSIPENTWFNRMSALPPVTDEDDDL